MHQHMMSAALYQSVSINRQNRASLLARLLCQDDYHGTMKIWERFQQWSLPSASGAELAAAVVFCIWNSATTACSFNMACQN